MNSNDQKRVSACCGAEIDRTPFYGNQPLPFCSKCHQMCNSQPCELVREGGWGKCVKHGVVFEKVCSGCEKDNNPSAPAEPREEKPIDDMDTSTDTHTKPPQPMGTSAEPREERCKCETCIAYHISDCHRNLGCQRCNPQGDIAPAEPPRPEKRGKPAPHPRLLSLIIQALREDGNIDEQLDAILDYVAKVEAAAREEGARGKVFESIEITSQYQIPDLVKNEIKARAIREERERIREKIEKLINVSEMCACPFCKQRLLGVRDCLALLEPKQPNE